MKITASKIRQNSSVLQKAIKEDIVVTKRDEPFVVIVDYEKYLEISSLAEKYKREHESQKMTDRWLSSAQESEQTLHSEDLNLKNELQQNYDDLLGNSND